jgi:hypothetical protein
MRFFCKILWIAGLALGLLDQLTLPAQADASALDLSKPVYLAKGTIACGEYFVVLEFMAAQLRTSTNAAASHAVADKLLSMPLQPGCEMMAARTMVRIVDESKANDSILSVHRLTDRPGENLVVFSRNLEN